MPYSPEKLGQVVERIRRVPDSMRTFSQTPADALRIHRIGGSLLTHLLDLGLPHRVVSGGTPLFDEFDLSNVGVTLDLSSARRMAMRWWSKALAKSVPGTRSIYSIESLAACPSPGHPGACQFSLNALVAEAVCPGSLREPAPGQYTFDVLLTCRLHYFGEDFAPLIEQVTDLEFHLLPVDNAKSYDLGFLADTGLADCRLATKFLVRLGRSLGLPVRPAIGYLVAPPYPQPHGWIEFEEDGIWRAADPFLLHSLAKWGIIDSGQWPPHRSPEGLMWRLSDRGLCVIAHGDSAVYPKLVVVSRSDVRDDESQPASRRDERV